MSVLNSADILCSKNWQNYITLFYHIIMYIPAGMKHSVIIALYKGKHKPRSELSSYRGVSLTPTLNKVFEKIILRRLKPWLVAHDFPLPYNKLGETRLIVYAYLTSFRSPLNT